MEHSMEHQSIYKLTGMFVGGGKKLENSKETQADRGEHAKLFNTNSGLNRGCEAAMLLSVSLCCRILAALK